jgi:filamentous hemagglutinin
MHVLPARFPTIREHLLSVIVSALLAGTAAAGPVLPTPCATGACGAAGPAQFVTGGAATAVATQNTLTINQTSNSAILNWSSFNVGANGSVSFHQPAASSIALNRIFQNSPSQIFGNLSANGQVYLVNLNGFLFGATSTVNVGSLLVSSLPLALNDANFKNGILSPIANSAAVLDATLDPLAPGVGRASVLDANGLPVLDANGKPLAVQVVVQPGAQLTAADQGRLLLAGQSVTNGGVLSAPDGQVILAAGAKVYLQADTDPSLRGLVVEVDQGGKAWNQLTGTLSAPRGNITMVGLAVNQEGRISATTSVAANGSIRLEAADTAVFSSQVVSSSHGGTLTIGPQSTMDILPETSSGATAVPSQTQYPSSVTLLGEQVLLQGGSIVALSADLTAIAAANPSPAAANPVGGVAGSGDPNARLRIDPGTTIDLSGSSATLPVTANLASGQLRSAELADDPTQRNGPLHGLTVYFDARNPPSPQLADLSGEIAAIPQNVAQRTETGGTATFQSENDIVFAPGASLNVSGGSTTYVGGVMQTSYLVGANGQLYPIATANPLLTYIGVVNPTFSQTYNKWGVQDVLPSPGLSVFQPGYVQGAAAGNVQFAAPTLVLQGSLEGSAVNGLYQRTPATRASGGQLVIGLPGGVGASAANNLIDYLSPGVRFSTAPTPVVVSDDAPLPSQQLLELPLSYLTGSGFTSTQIYSNYGVTLPANTPLVLPPGSTLAVDAARVDVLSNITDPSGALSLQNVLNVGSAAATPRPGVYVGEGVTLDVRGQWTNDAQLGPAASLGQIWQNGGSINLGIASPGALLSIADDVTLRASGGAWLNSSGALAGGTGGSITLNENVLGGGFDVGNNVALEAFGVNGAAGGTFNLTAPRIEISSGSGAWAAGQQVDDAQALGNVLQLHPSLFANYGFESINLVASGLPAPGAPSTTVLSVDPGTVIGATVATLALGSHIGSSPSAATLDGLASVTTFAPYLQSAAVVSLSALPPPGSLQATQLGVASAGDISIGTGASLTTGAGGSISLTGLDSILLDGTLRAPGGTVSLQILTPGANKGAYDNYEAGFLPNQRIELGGSGTIDVSGTFVARPSTLGLDLGTAYAGGSINLFADRGAVVTDAGSNLSLAGISAAEDVLQADGFYGHQIAATAGGSLAVRSGESISLLGTIAARAGAGGSSRTAAGSLDIALTRSESWWDGGQSLAAADTFNGGPLTIELTPSVATSGLPSAAASNQAFLGAAQITQWGIDALRIEAGSALQLSGTASLALARQLVIDAPAVETFSGTQAALSAPYLEVGYQALNGTTGAAASGGSGAVAFSGAEIDLVGTTVFQGTSNVKFTSSGDLVLRGDGIGSGASAFAGALTVAGNLTLDAARIFPVTAATFAINAEAAPGAPGALTIGQTAPNPGTPFSAGAALSLTADNITSTGSVYAPFGTISLNANDSLSLGDGSVTSVSGGGLTIPYGETQYGGQGWIYGAYTGHSPSTVAGVPTRTVTLTAPTVSIAGKATVDLTGGGDLSAFEWVPGTGGTIDALAAGAIPGLYAIVPSIAGHAAPQDPELTGGSGMGPAASVYLSGGGGLAAGTYTLLPARYGLSPGAFLIQGEPQYQSVGPGSLGALPDGTPVVAGFLTYGTTGLHAAPGYMGFAVYPGSYGRQLAAYDVSLASNFFSAAATAAGAPRPTLPADAGTLSIAVTTALNAEGQVLTSAASGGRAASIEISADDLVVGTPTGPLAADAVRISGSVLNGWQPGSLLLGGTSSADGGTINVLANTVTVGAGTTLSADQIVVVAGQAIDVQTGAKLQSTSAISGTAPATLPAANPVTLTGAGNGSAALLAVSDLNWLIPERTAGAPPAGAATVAIDPGASIASRGSLSLDGIGGVSVNGAVTGPGAEWSLGSSSVAVVPTGVQADAFSIGPNLVAQLGAAAAVRIASTGGIDLLTPLTLGVDANGTPTLASLTLSASSLNNFAGTATSRLGAHTLVLEGATGSAGSSGVAGLPGATLALSAGELDLGPDTLTVNGFATTRAVVSGAVIGKGTGGLRIGGDLSIEAAGVTAAPAADTDLAATGALSVMPLAGTPGALPVLTGGALSLSGGSVDISGTVAAPAGMISIASAGDLNVAATGSISTAGTVVAIGNQSADTPGGTVALNAVDALTLSAGATLNVSGAGAAAGGTLALSAGGAASLGATLRGTNGSLSLDAGSMITPAGTNPLTSLATSLSAGGFNDAVDVRVRTGDLVLDPGSAVSAQAVTLTADTGRIDIGGEISANSGAARGSLSIFGGAGVVLESGAALHADGAGAAGRGGTIEIGAGQLVVGPSGMLDTYNGATLSLNPGSTISTSGAAGEGTLLLRAPALAASNDVGIQSLASNTSAVGQIIVEPLLPFNTGALSSATAPTAADFQQVQQTVGNYMAAAGTSIANRLAPAGGTPLMVEPGVEIIAPGALTLQSADGVSPALDLSSWRYANAAPVDLTIRAAGDLTIANTITDGFTNVTLGGVVQPALLTGPSASIRLIAGADLASANPLAVLHGGSGTLTLGLAPSASAAAPATAVVRTGSGDIDLIAAADVVIGNPGSGAYTAGTPAIAPGATAADPYAGIPRQVLGRDVLYGITIPNSGLLLSFPTGGGDLLVNAGRDISAPQNAPGTTLGVPNWQIREGGGTYGSGLPVPAEWGVNLANFNWNFATLGGGDVHITAGRDALNVSAAAAGSLLPQYGGAIQYVTSGGLTLTAGRNVGSASVFLADGTGHVAAGGALTAILPSLNPGDPSVGSAFYLQNSTLDVTARLDIAVGGVFNPTALNQVTTGTTSSVPTALAGSFFSYGDGSALTLQSAAGGVALGAANYSSQTLLGLNLQNAAGVGGDVLPATVSIAALGGSIDFGPGFGGGGSVTLYAAPRGQLDLLASQDITNGVVKMSDAAAGSIASVASPISQTLIDTTAFTGDIHTGDSAPALVTAGRDITGLTLSIPKAAQVVAGRDIVDLTYAGQNLTATDQTVLMAGRDFEYTNGYGNAGVSVGGPGTLDILTDRNVALGFSPGIVTTGNLLNPNLPTPAGADLSIVTGLGTTPDYAGLLAKIIEPSTAYQTQLVNYVETEQGTSNLSFATAEAAFRNFTPAQQLPLIDDVFFNELSLSGLAANATPKVGFNEGYAAIDALFPGSRTGAAGAAANAYAGDLTLQFSRIYTLSGGNITLVVPGGHVDVGLANPPDFLVSRAPSTLGIVTEQSGNLDIYARGDVNVNSSRIFTLGGGNILIWSDEGSIDAGQGAKTSVSAPPPSILINSDGTVSLNFSGAASGSGIRTIQTEPTTPPGNVDLIAPEGTVNAGDAGIGAAGNINIAAASVIGVSNINFGGTATGVPAQVSSIGASLAGASNAASSTSNSSANSLAANAADKEAAAPLAQTALSWLDVFVTGLGEENCKPDDIECLKRQKTPTR